MSYPLGYTDRLILVPISQWQVPFNQPFLSASKSGTLTLNERYRRITPSRKHWFSNRIFLRNALRPMNHLKLTYSKNDQNRSEIILHVYVRSLMWKFDKNIPKGSVLDLNNQWQFFNCHSSMVTTQRLFHIIVKTLRSLSTMFHASILKTGDRSSVYKPQRQHQMTTLTDNSWLRWGWTFWWLCIPQKIPYVC